MFVCLFVLLFSVDFSGGVFHHLKMCFYLVGNISDILLGVAAEDNR